MCIRDRLGGVGFRGNTAFDNRDLSEECGLKGGEALSDKALSSAIACLLYTSKSTREHLLNTGAMIVGESGLRALTVRGLSLRAGTNTGLSLIHISSPADLTALFQKRP